MPLTSGRLVFKIGEVFPADDPVAVFLVALSTALNDLLFASRLLVGGDNEEPSVREPSDVEQQFLLRLSIGFVYEVRESIKHARKEKKVERFLAGLPDAAQAAMAAIGDVNPPEGPWVRKAMEHIRNQAFHYGGKWNWEDIEWAMRAVANEEGDIEMANSQLVGMRMRFADLVAIQHMGRRFPEYQDDPEAEPGEEIINERLRTLVKAVRSIVTAAMNFAVEAIDTYFDSLPDGVVRSEPLVPGAPDAAAATSNSPST